MSPRRPPRALALLALTSGCGGITYRELGEALLISGLFVGLAGVAMVALLQRAWSVALGAKPSPWALPAGLLVGAGSTALGVALNRTISAAAMRAAGVPERLALGAWLREVYFDSLLFGAAVLTVALVAWRATARSRPTRAAWIALPGVLGLNAALALGAVAVGRGTVPSDLHEALFWLGGLGATPVVVWVALAIEGLLRRRAIARAGG